METVLAQFFRRDRQAMIVKRFQDDRQFYQSGPAFLSPASAFSGPQLIGTYAYVCGQYPVALDLFQAACEAGPSLLSMSPGSFPETRLSQCRILLDLGRTAFLCGRSDLSRDAFLRAHELAPHEDEIVNEVIKRAGDANTYRHYAAIAHGAHEATLPTKRRGLDQVLAALIQVRQGQLTETQATQSLNNLILLTRDHVEKIDAISHALYFQTAFPDVFNMVLPPLPTEGHP